MNRIKIVPTLLLAFLIWGLAAPQPAWAQEESTAQRIIRDVLGIGGKDFAPIIQEGQGLTGCGSWVTSGKKYLDPLALDKSGKWLYPDLSNASDCDLRLLLDVPENTPKQELIKMYNDVRSQLQTRIKKTFGRNADRVMQSINLYPPEQLMKGVGSAEDAIEALKDLPGGTPNLGGKSPEGLWTKGRLEFTRAYEGKGKIFYNQGGKMRQGFADFVSDIVKGEKDAILNTIPGATSNAEGFASKTYEALREGKSKDLMKNTERAEGALQRARALSGQPEAKSRLFDEIMNRAKSDPFYYTKPDVQRMISRYAKEASLEARLLEKLQTAGDADKQLILRWLEEMRAGAGAWEKLWGVFEKLPLQEFAVVLNGIFSFYQGWVIGGKIVEGDYIGALKEVGIWAVFEAAGIGTGLCVILADYVVEQAKSFGYELMASTQDCGDLMEGIFTVKGREVNILDAKIRSLTVDDLVLLYQKPQDIEKVIAHRARLATGRGFGEETGKSDAEVAKTLTSRCYKELLIPWNAKRRELDREMVGLWQELNRGPILLTVTPDPAVFSPKQQPFPIRARVETPQIDISGIESRMKDLLDRLAGPKEHSQGAEYRWTLDGKPIFGSRESIDFEVDSAGEHLVEVELVFKIYSSLNYSRKLPEVRRKVSAPLNIILKEEPATQEKKKIEEKAGQVAGPAPKKTEEQPGQKGKSQKTVPGKKEPSGGPPSIFIGDIGNIRFTAPPKWEVFDRSAENRVQIRKDVIYGDQVANVQGVVDIRISSNRSGAGGASGQSFSVGPFRGDLASDKEGQSLRATLTYEKELLAITGNVSGSIINEGPVFNDRDREAHQKVEKWLKEQTQLAQSEMQAIIRSLRYLSGELSVQLKLEKTVISLRDTVRVQALADGGTPPYQYAWTDNYGTGKDKSEILFTANQPGEYKVSVTVTDHAGKQVTDTVTLTISGLTAELSMNPSGRKLKLGETRNFNVVVKAGKEAARGPFDYLWQPHPEVTFTPFEGSATTSAAFTKIGPVKVWAQVFQMSEGQKQTVAESDQLELEVVSPKFSLSAEPKDPYVGQEVKVTVASDPALQAPPWDYWWEVSGNTLNAGPISQNREYTFIPKDTNAVTVTVHGKAKEGGTDLGEKKQIVKAKFYEVKVGKPALQGSPPRVWSEKAKGLVELERGIGTFQDFSISADISPKPAAVPLRYQWKVDPEGCSVLSPASRETRANAGQGGSYTFQVTVSDSRDIVLGSGQTDVTITEVTLPAKAQGAADKFNQAKTLAGECKLDQAIPVAEEACQLDPRNKDAARLSQDLKAMKTSMLQYLSQAQSLGQQGKYEEASAALAKAKGLCPSYVPLAAYEWQLQNLQKQKDQQTQQLQQQQQQQKEAKDKADAASKAKQAALDKLKLSGSLAQDGKLDEAISAAEEAAQLDPANPEGARYANYLKSVRDQVLQHLSRAQALGGQGKLAEAAAALAKAKALCPNYGPVTAYEAQLDGLQAEKQRQLQQQQAEAKRQQQREQEAQQQPQQPSAAGQTESQVAANREASSQKLQQAIQLAKQTKFDEAISLAEEALRLDPENEEASSRIITWKALKHLQRAGILGEQGRLEEASEEVKQAKKIAPNNPKVAEFEQWLDNLKKQQAYKKAQEAQKAAEAERQKQAEKERAKAAEEQRRKEEEQRQAEETAEKSTSWTAELKGTSWQGEAAVVSDTTGRQMNMPIAFTIDNDGSISGQLTFGFFGWGPQNAELQGSYDVESGEFAVRFNYSGEGVSLQGKLIGTAKSSTSAEGNATAKISGASADGNYNGTWRLTRQ